MVWSVEKMLNGSDTGADRGLDSDSRRGCFCSRCFYFGSGGGIMSLLREFLFVRF